MASLAEIQTLLEQIRDELPALVNRSKISPQQVTIVSGLSDISERLGLVQAGEFRTGNSKEPGFGFSGVRIGYPSFTYDGELWHIVGIENDTLQFGLRATDGKALAGGGVVILDDSGAAIVGWSGVESDLNAFKFTDGNAVLGGMYGGRSIPTANTIALSSKDNDSCYLTLGATGSDDSHIWMTASSSGIAALLRLDSTSGGQKDISLFANHVFFKQGDATFAELSSTPSDPTSGTETRLYMKSDKLIIQYNDGGTIRYKYLDLTGTGVSWTHTTSAP